MQMFRSTAELRWRLMVRIHVRPLQFQQRRFLASSTTRSGVVRIGNVERDLPTSLSAEQHHKVPKGYLAAVRNDATLLSHLQWLLQKDVLKQDSLLVGAPGAAAVQRRRLVMAYAELIQRPIEILTLSKDTTATDLKQRRSLVDGDVIFTDQAPVRAALNGHLLLLDGLQTVERNVLPTLNNLLENRELPLEDGRLLVSAERYAHLQKNHHHGQSDSLYVPVNADFRVISTMSVDARYKLDPPVRSRFQIRRVDAAVVFPSATAPAIDAKATIATLFATTMQQAAKSSAKSSHHQHFPTETAVPAISTALEKFSQTPLADLIARHYPYAPNGEPRLAAAMSKWPTACAAATTVQRVYDELRILPSPSQEKTYKLDRIESGGTNNNSDTMCAHFVNPEVRVVVPSGGIVGEVSKNVSDIASQQQHRSYIVNEETNVLLTAMMQEHSVGRDILLASPKGEGKSVLAQQFAEMLSYQIHLFPLYKEMTATDLLQRRTATGWAPSPLLQAAMTGQICVLDGIEKLSRDTLATLQGLLTDREVSLSDGTKYAQHHNRGTAAVRGEHGVIHPSFRVIALGSISGSSRRSAAPPTWLSEEATSMFSTIAVPAPDRAGLLDMLRPYNKYSEKELNQLLAFHERLLNVAEDCGVAPLSIRTMMRIVKRGGNVGDTTTSLHDNICTTLLAGLLTPTQRATLEALLTTAGIGGTGRKARKKKALAELAESLQVSTNEHSLHIGKFEMPRQTAKNPELVPSPYFFDIADHVRMIRTLLSEWTVGERAFLLLGNQGTGKNKICDRICELANFEREYMQLHRDSTIGQLTMSPSLEDGKVVWKDSPLVRAVTHGRALVIDEADKAPLEVVAVLKSLIEDGELLLADGRRILRAPEAGDDNCIAIHPYFTVWVLANRPGRLFHGNDIVSEIGDCFSSHVVPNPDLKSEIRLLQAYAPNVDVSLLRRVAASFDELRCMFERGDILYPYSTRESVAIATHLEKYPDDDVVTVLHNVLDLDSFDEHLYVALGDVFRTHGFAFEAYETWKKIASASQRGGDLEIEYKTDRSFEGTSDPPPLSSPKLGKWDDKNEPHVGGNQWQGGTGGSDTAGLGGRGGPYRLDRGHKVHQVSEEAKSHVSEEAKAAARRIAEKALKEKLDSIGMSEEANDMYESLLLRIKGDVANLRSSLAQVEYKVSERDWINRQLDGELDDARLVEGIAGEKHIYRRRGVVEPTDTGIDSRRKRLRFVVDCSGSMYRFNGYDNRLQRCLEATALVMESFDGMSERFDYSIVGHSGDSRCIALVDFGKPPANEKERLTVLQTMVYHSQYCQSGDNTLGAIKQAVADVSPYELNGDETNSGAIVIAISDANLERYGIHPRELGRVLHSASSDTKAYCIFIASFGKEAEQIKKELPMGRGFVCMDSSELPAVVRDILTSEIGC